jgi:hypothetical protein
MKRSAATSQSRHVSLAAKCIRLIPPLLSTIKTPNRFSKFHSVFHLAIRFDTAQIQLADNAPELAAPLSKVSLSMIVIMPAFGIVRNTKDLKREDLEKLHSPFGGHETRTNDFKRFSQTKAKRHPFSCFEVAERLANKAPSQT